MENESLKVQLFKELRIGYKGESICIDDMGTKQMINLLVIFLYYRHNPISKDKLIEYMWQDNENPLNVMKFSIYRLRSFLKTLPGLKDMDAIVTTKKGYCFNPHIKIEADFEIVDEAWNKMNDSKLSNEEVINNAKLILDLYAGTIFGNNTEFWMLQAQSYYQNVYDKALNMYGDHLNRNKLYKELIMCGEKAIGIYTYDEEAYYFYIQGLIEDKQYRKALEIFHRAQTKFFQEFGTPLSLKLKKLYNVMIARDEEDELDVSTLKEKLDVELSNDGAFYCEYESFKYIYQVELRKAVRDNIETFLILFEIRSTGGVKEQRVSMDKLKTVIELSLRKGDVFSRMNKVQYVVLLPCQNIDNAHNIIHRITSTYYRKVAKDKVKLHYHISSLLAVKEKEPKELR